MSFWRYRGQCVGRVIHFLYCYCNLDVAEQAKIGNNEVFYRGELFATFKWSEEFGEIDVPEFTFYQSKKLFESDNYKLYTQNQKEKREEAILSCITSVLTDETELKEVDSEIVRTFIDNTQFRILNLRAQLFSNGKENVKFYFHKEGKEMYAKCSELTFVYNKDLKNWLRNS